MAALSAFFVGRAFLCNGAIRLYRFAADPLRLATGQWAWRDDGGLSGPAVTMGLSARNARRVDYRGPRSPFFIRRAVGCFMASGEVGSSGSSFSGSFDMTSLHLDQVTASASVADVVESQSLGARLDPTEVTVFDIETGPVDNLADLLEPDGEIPPFNESDVKLGNLKDESKIRDKIELERAKHQDEWRAKRAKYKQDAFDKAALSPLTGQIVAIGYGDATGRRIIHGASEEAMLTEFWHFYKQVEHKATGRIAGWNIFGFDLPFIVRRSWLHEVPVPVGVRKDRRYWSSLFNDLQAEFDAGTSGYTKLDAATKFFGLGGKNGNGGEFAKLWQEDRPRAIAYLTNDIHITIGVARRMGIL